MRGVEIAERGLEHLLRGLKKSTILIKRLPGGYKAFIRGGGVEAFTRGVKSVYQGSKESLPGGFRAFPQDGSKRLPRGLRAFTRGV